MSNLRVVSRSFIGGEMSPEMFGRVDDAKFQNGAATVRNMIVKPQGTAFRRPGFKLVAAVKDSTKATRLIPCRYNTQDSLVIEVGEGYFRFYTSGAAVGYGTPAAFKAPTYVTTSGAGGFTNGYDATNDKFQLATAVPFATGDPVNITLAVTGALPPEIAAGTTYYAIVGGALAANEIRLATTLSNAVAGTYITMTGASAGGASDRRFHYVYEIADMVSFTVGPTTHYHYHIAENYNIHAEGDPSDTSYWYQMPDTGQLEIPNSYTAAELFAITYFQSADVMTLLHGSHNPAELRRYSATDWVLADVAFAAAVDTPTGLAVTGTSGKALVVDYATRGTGGPTYEITFRTRTVHKLVVGDPIVIAGLYAQSITMNYDYDTTLDFGQYYIYSTPTTTTFRVARVSTQEEVWATIAASTALTGCTIRYATLSSENTQTYKVSAVDSNGSESSPSSAVEVVNNLFVDGSYNTLTWDAVTGAKRYRIYKLRDGLYGYIGEVSADETLEFTDDNIGPDLGVSPPIVDNGFINGIQPSCGCYFEQRRVFASDTDQPESIWMTRSGTESDVTYHLPVQDSDRIYFAISSREPSSILHCVPMVHLILLTGTCEYRVSPVNSDAITPATISVRPQSFIGTTTVRPLTMNDSLVFAAARGGHVRDFTYSNDGNGYVTGDLSLRASHLFDGLTIVDSAQSKAPMPIMWFVSSNGILLGMTYIPEENVGAWHWHDCAGTFESVAAVSEGVEDHLYAIVHYGSGRYVCRMADMTVDEANPEDAHYVDLGISGTDTAKTAWTVGTHLNGEDVSILGDGRVQEPVTVSSGVATIGTAAATVQIGLPYTSEIRTLPLAMQIDGAGQGRTKNVNGAWVRVYQSGDFEIGPDEDSLVPAADATGLLSDLYQVKLLPDWTGDGSFIVRQTDPTPLNVVSIVIEAAIGG